MSFFKKTNDGSKQMIIFAIVKQFEQPTLAGESKNVKYHSRFARFENF